MWIVDLTFFVYAKTKKLLTALLGLKCNEVSFSMKKLIALIAWMVLVPSFLLAQQWVDMGVRAENGDIIYWSNSDFAISQNGSIRFVEYGKIGSEIGWGDITGSVIGSDLSKYGGVNPLGHIEGNPQYDIITAKLGSPYRLPTFDEFNELAKNCDFTIKTVVVEQKQGKDGLPSWVQGQWMCHNAALINGQVFNVSVSLKIDGYLASVYTSDNNYWEGSYSYTNGVLKVWKLTLKIDESEKSIKDDRNYQYQKISNNTESRKIKGMLLKSKINGNTLFFPFPSSTSTFTTKRYTITSVNPYSPSATYWTATLSKQSKNDAYAAFFGLNEASGIVYNPRSYHNRIRAIKVDVGSGARLAKEKRIAEQKAAEERARQEELERRRAEEEKRRYEQLRTEAYANDPIIKALLVFESNENLSDIFDYKLYYEMPNVAGVPQKCGVLLFLNANKKTKDFYKKYKQMVGDRTKPNDTYRQFVEEKFNDVLPYLISSLSNFCIVDAKGQTYSFKLVETLPKGLEQKSWLKYEIKGTPSYSSCILRANLDEKVVGNLTIGTVNLGNIPFLQKEHHKGDKLYYCDFQLPFSSSFSIIVNGKTIKGERVGYSEFYQLKQGKSMTEIIIRGGADMRRNIRQNNNRQRQIYHIPTSNNRR